MTLHEDRSRSFENDTGPAGTYGGSDDVSAPPGTLESEAAPNLLSGLTTLLARLIGIAFLLAVASGSLYLYHRLSWKGEQGSSASPGQPLETDTVPPSAEPGSEGRDPLRIEDASPVAPLTRSSDEPAKTSIQPPDTLVQAADFTTAETCREHLKAIATKKGPVRRSGNLVFLFDDRGSVVQAWYDGETDGRLARGRLDSALAEIPCFRGWRLPTVGELRTLVRRLRNLPPRASKLPEGIWTAEDDGLGAEWKIYFPSRDEYELRGEAYTWWFAAVTDTVPGGEYSADVPAESF